MLEKKKQIEQLIAQSISSLGPPSKLREACAYALQNGGKRFRPLLVYAVTEAIGKKQDVSYSALAVEYFHTASLIADDLPCMDNEEMRRGVPSLHKVYGESTALLVNYALIAAGYGFIAKNANGCGQVCTLAVENASFNTGLCGATGGQYMDLYPSQISLETIQEIIRLKTNSLFELSFVLGWACGGGDLAKIDLVKKAASHFGMAFQIMDDLQDQEQDKKNGRFINIALACGKGRAVQLAAKEIEAFYETIRKLQIDVQPFEIFAGLIGVKNLKALS